MNRWSSLRENDVENDERKNWSLKESCHIVTKKAKSDDHMRNRETDKKESTQTPSQIFQV